MIIQFLKFSFLSQGYARFINVLLLAIGVAFIETAGVLSILPFLQQLLNLNEPLDNELLNGFLDLSIWGQIFRYFSINDPIIVRLVTLGCLSIFVLFAGAMLRITSTYFIHKFIERLRRDVSKNILQTVGNSGLLNVQDFSRKFNLQSLLTSDLDQLVQQVIRPVFFGLANSFVVISLCVVLIYFEPLITLYAVLTFLFLYLVVFRFVRSNLTKYGKLMSDSNSIRFFSIRALIDLFGVLKISRKEGFVISSFDEAQGDFCQSQVNYNTINILPRYIVELVAFSLLIAFSLYVALSQNNPNVSSEFLGIIALFGLAAYRIQPAALWIYQGVANLRYGEEIFSRLTKALNIKTDLNENYFFQNSKKKNSSISFDNVTFQYPNDHLKIINEISFSMNKGQNILILGTSGSGKSTLLNLICGLYRPDAGKIFLNKNDDTLANNRSSLFSIVPQNITMLPGTVAENIMLEKINIDKYQNDKLMKAVFHEAALDSVFNNIDEIYTKKINPSAPEFSGGQLQRIAIARALYQNRDFIVLDEATSALNDEIEEDIISSLIDSVNDKSIICVTHNKKLSKFFKRVIELENGKIASDKIL